MMVSVIVPTYKEREAVPRLLARLLPVLRGLPVPSEVLIVDDHSPDGTTEAARTAASRLGAEEQVRVIEREGKRGLSDSVLEAFALAEGELLVVMDADLSHPPEMIGPLLEPLFSGRADVSVASRYVPGGGMENWPLPRRIMSRVANFLARPLVKVKDATSGFFAVRRSAIEGVPLKPVGYKVGLEVFVKSKASSIAEVPYVFRDRVAGKSKLGVSVTLLYLLHLAALSRYRFPRFIRYMQFCAVGALGLVLDTAAFSLSYFEFGLEHLGTEVGTFLAQSVSFLVAVSFNFVLNRVWTFRERTISRWGVFLAVCAGGFVLRSIVILGIVALAELASAPFSLEGLVAFLGMERVALFLGIAVASVWNFLASNAWAFRGKAGETPGP